MSEHDKEFDRRESVWELKDILRDVDRLLEDSNVLTDIESSYLLSARDSLNNALRALEHRRV